MSLYDDLWETFEKEFIGKPFKLKMIYSDSFEVICEKNYIDEVDLINIEGIFEEYEPKLIEVKIAKLNKLMLTFEADIGFDEEYDSDFLDESNLNDYSRGGGNDPSL